MLSVSSMLIKIQNACMDATWNNFPAGSTRGIFQTLFGLNFNLKSVLLVFRVLKRFLDIELGCPPLSLRKELVPVVVSFMAHLKKYCFIKQGLYSLCKKVRNRRGPDRSHYFLPSKTGKKLKKFLNLG